VHRRIRRSGRRSGTENHLQVNRQISSKVIQVNLKFSS
jgi:hypothetical protein